MKRGLVEWDEQEVPRSALESRLGRVRAWGRQHGLDALVFHTSDSHTQPVRYLTHFLLYWNEGVLVVPCSQAAEVVLVYGLSGRVIEWVRRTSTLTQAVSARDIGGAVASLLAERGYRQVGIAEPEVFPTPILDRFSTFVDASDVLALLGLDEAERRLQRTAQRLCQDAFARLAAGQTHWQAAAAFHGAARLDGAEDVSLFVGEPPAWPGPPRDASLADGAYLLGRVEYKGAWHQAARTLGVPTAPAWFADLVARVRPGLKVKVDDLAAARVEDLSGPAPFRQLGPDATLRAGQAVAVTARRDSVLWGETLLLHGTD
jgi:hypothetical protein